MKFNIGDYVYAVFSEDFTCEKISCIYGSIIRVTQFENQTISDGGIVTMYRISSKRYRAGTRSLDIFEANIFKNENEAEAKLLEMAKVSFSWHKDL